MDEPIISIRHLQTLFNVDGRVSKAVDDVSFSVPKGKVVCIVGESGCGKSVTALSILRLIDFPGRIAGGEIMFHNRDILEMNNKEIHNLRGDKISMIFQEPMTSLNPVFTIGRQISETIQEHTLCDRKEAWEKGVELIKKVGLPRAEQIMVSYPHELSGGMLQRVMIAIALSCEPELLIADEPTTALDVTIQAQVLDLLRQLRDQSDMSILFITHDLGVVAEIADYVIVMYAGKIIEEAPVIELFRHPRHPYTRGLLKSRPVIGQRRERLYSIKGQVPELSELRKGCYFAERCESCMEACLQDYPETVSDSGGHKTACLLYKEGVADGTTIAEDY
ncbi:MAG: oligopeptide/dipeptide transporter, ATP-binding protein [Eubacterium sp.]|jgi:peptide/nickel transport system ATP-binding protein|nr:oligopeptide/dipeptide transporter, ATP-binding protein [Eubacterium sp.]